MKISTKDKERFKQKFIKNGACWEWVACLTDKGYGRFSLFGKPERAHRVSYQIYTGVVPSGLFVLHSCDNPLCVNPAHLFVGSQQENITDMKNKCRGNVGEKNGSVVLTESEVLSIRTMDKSLNLREISEAYGIGKSTVYDIVKRRTWKHI